ncbi:kinase-like domain-containing protein, partial [Pavlovales sp. CCMP2436]
MTTRPTRRRTPRAASAGCASRRRGRGTLRSHRPRLRASPRARPPASTQQLDVLLGEGSFKTVYRGFDSEKGREVAWNVVKFTKVPNAIAEQQIETEIELLQNLHHPNIINFFGHFRSLDNRLVFITEMMTSGTLKEFVGKHKRIKRKIVKDWCRQILSGLAFLHEGSIIHRDLKCDNIFINGHAGEVKIGDLGLSTSTGILSHAASVIGTPEFMAPEMYNESYNRLVDIYAFGMCVMEMVTNEYPYAECRNAAQIFKKVTQGIRPSALERIVDQETRDFINLCVEPEPADRKEASELLQHPFLTGKLGDN